MEAIGNETRVEVVFSVRPEAGVIRLPAELLERIPDGQLLRVVVAWESSDQTNSPPIPAADDEPSDADWSRMGACLMAKGYETDPVDDNYDDLLER
jgi:pyruvoyl-dependent arginine decarboxylase (PvlArgDC)